MEEDLICSSIFVDMKNFDPFASLTMTIELDVGDDNCCAAFALALIVVADDGNNIFAAVSTSAVM
eukprot:9006106-Ditylum_brightwellii.AAC.1